MTTCYNKSITDWNRFPDHDLIWTDPPWGVGALKMFQTMMLKQTGIKSDLDLITILNHLAEKSSARRPLFIEYSVKGHESVVKIMENHQHVLTSAQEMLQYNRKPFMVLGFNTEYVPDPKGIGFDIVKAAVTAFATAAGRPVTVFDPFAGIGQTAAAVRSCGCNYIGSEPNTARFRRLEKACL